MSADQHAALRIRQLEAALRSIRKAAGTAMQLTNRLQFIYARAGVALAGDNWDESWKAEHGYDARNKIAAKAAEVEERNRDLLSALVFAEQIIARNVYARRFGHIPGIHMPRDASRILLEVTGVRVERVQAITEGDAMAEGVERDTEPCDHARQSCEDIGCLGKTHKASFCDLWCDLNGIPSWTNNPWVWVVEFKKVGA
ncbi:hypothetical protein AX768_08995 [Burkholderia sp. PAMC 28687]|uniref:hypothetical protein n=1 Tax=Burkholderia sp. PAMC 28687 TaxID=1795874 RepID=UPI000782B22C|nr:hypothetical protein [Burkholderia sp. PAMC 28687]AMM14208.1 hypothetical protein AX768_08995 [Burkholderia sp. PAMC 28687]